MAADDARFSIVYDGEDVAEGAIDAKDLAPALLALAELFDEAHDLALPPEVQIRLRVRAGFEQGSFEVSLELATFYQQIVSLFGSSEASAWANLFQILGISGVLGTGFGLFQLIKHGRGRRTTSVTVEHTERVKITFEGDAEPVSVDRRVWELFKNLRARKAVERIVEPLKSRGIDLFKVRHKGKDTVEVTRDDFPAFVAPTEHEGETISVTDTRVTIVAPSFEEENKWRVSDGSRTIYVAIEDEAFMHAVQSGEAAFRKNDILHVKLQIRQWIELGKLKAIYSIVQVIRHERGPEQGKLLGDDDAESQP
ncbi:MAG: hypothetical protein GEV05_06435 [Betaproteobacteria bacterium]|nr:hypothetical protein [Betaproteobacteria bacterium]